MPDPVLEEIAICEELTAPAEHYVGEPMDIDALWEGDDTKAVTYYEDARLKINWEAGDGFVIKPHDKQNDAAYASVFTLTSGAGTNVATFSGNAPVTSSNGYYMVFFPASITTYSTFAYFDYRGQVQSGNGNAAHMAKKFSAYYQTRTYPRVQFSETTANYKQTSAFHFLIGDLPEPLDPTGLVLEISGPSGTSFSIYNRNDLDGAKVKMLSMELKDFGSTSSLDVFMARDMNQLVIPAGDTLSLAVSGKRADGSKVEYVMKRPISSSITLKASRMHRLRFDNAYGSWEAASSSLNYESSDYSKDMTLCFAQRASVKMDRPLDIVFLGDGYVDKDMALYKEDMEWMREQLFSIEPFKSYREYFNLYSAYAVSPEHLKYTRYANGAGMQECRTALSAKMTAGSTVISGNNSLVYEYAHQAIKDAEGISSLSSLRTRNVLAIVMLNADAHAGTAHQSYSSSYGTDFGEGSTVAYVAKNSNVTRRRGVLIHEAGGHGFGKLADEYSGKTTIGGTGVTSDDRYKIERVFHPLGWRMNVSATQTFNSAYDATLYDVTRVAWEDFLGDPDYSGIGKFLGGNGYNSWFWRPTENSIMRQSGECPYFNAPSRRAIWYRINKMADKWFINDYHAFRAWDFAHGDRIPASVNALGYDPACLLAEIPGEWPDEVHTPPIVTEE